MDRTLLEVIMDTTRKLVHGLISYVDQNPNEQEEVRTTLLDIATKLELGEMSIIDISSYIKEMKMSHNVAVFQIFVQLYRDMK